jgi:hypothetical protein
VSRITVSHKLQQRKILRDIFYGQTSWKVKFIHGGDVVLEKLAATILKQAITMF